MPSNAEGVHHGKSKLTLRCCACCPPNVLWRSVSLTELKLPPFFLRLRSLPIAERKVDFFRWGWPFCPFAAVEPVVFSELALAVEYRAVLDGFARCSFPVVELRAAEDRDRAPSGLGPGGPAGPVALDGGFVGVTGCSGTVCGTSMMSTRPPTGSACATGTGSDASGGGGGGGNGGAKDEVTGEPDAGGIACGCGGRCITRSLSIGVELAIPVPGFRMGNSSSSRRFDMGMGPDMRPRTDWWPVLGLVVAPAVAAVGEVGALPKNLAFMVVISSVVADELIFRPERGKVRDGMDDDVR